MLLSELCAIPLGRAWLCPTCQAISNAPRCMYCAEDIHEGRVTRWLPAEAPRVFVQTQEERERLQ